LGRRKELDRQDKPDRLIKTKKRTGQVRKWARRNVTSYEGESLVVCRSYLPATSS
jgi:hypothetical protein